VEFAEGDDKRYIAGLRLGITTDTQDTTGNILSQCDPHVSRDELLSALPRFTGEIEQIPPMYSAIKIGGKKLYELARRGAEVERKPRKITIRSIDLIEENGGDFILDVTCSKGTYIRTLCADIGDFLGCGGVMCSLRRVAAGGFTIGDAHTIDEIVAAKENDSLKDMILPVDSLFAHFPTVAIDDFQEKKCRNGNEFKVSLLDAGTYRVYSRSGEFLMLGANDNGTMRTIKSFFSV
jgi:tRNA pseudouridine55 synthase